MRFVDGLISLFVDRLSTIQPINHSTVYLYAWLLVNDSTNKPFNGFSLPLSFFDGKQHSEDTPLPFLALDFNLTLVRFYNHLAMV